MRDYANAAVSSSLRGGSRRGKYVSASLSGDYFLPHRFHGESRAGQAARSRRANARAIETSRTTASAIIVASRGDPSARLARFFDTPSPVSRRIASP